MAWWASLPTFQSTRSYSNVAKAASASVTAVDSAAGMTSVPAALAASVPAFLAASTASFAVVIAKIFALRSVSYVVTSAVFLARAVLWWFVIAVRMISSLLVISSEQGTYGVGTGAAGAGVS